MKVQQEEWEREVEDLNIHGYPGECASCTGSPCDCENAKKIKDFIRTQLQKEYERGRTDEARRVLNIRDNKEVSHEKFVQENTIDIKVTGDTMDVLDNRPRKLIERY